jgi:hypothetical protein
MHEGFLALLGQAGLARDPSGNASRARWIGAPLSSKAAPQLPLNAHAASPRPAPPDWIGMLAGIMSSGVARLLLLHRAVAIAPVGVLCRIR